MENTSPVKQLSTEKKLSFPTVLISFCLVIVLGAGVGYAGSLLAGGASGKSTSGKSTTEEKKGVGVFDKKRFPDTATGTMKAGGVDGEGSFHLERPGGESQNVYMTSSTVDLSQYVGKKVAVWGQTFEAQKAGWLMDVGYLEVK